MDKPEGAEKAPPHPQGSYDAVVAAAKADKTKNGKDMLRLEFKTGRGKVYGRLVHSPESDKANWAFFKQLANMGVGREFLDKDPDIDEVAMECVKARVMIDIEHREYQGETFADVRWISEAPKSDPALG